jgi:phosphoglucosamine mutase
MAQMVRSGRSLADLAGVLTRLPQVLINVAVTDKAEAVMAPAVADAIATAEAELGETGRVLLRPSGTEQLVRVMVEAPTESAAATIARRIATIVATAS